ncbi:protease inhibitor I9 family protein [Gottfriedia luciferensis]|uniref:protease inhibitor I9 family protein n=1 Tax=Gottfriedia luciferensis TaxID=178774 RepID=UPI001F36FFA1|nr:protease inhibitor I9 family protein [Gottfriedia luciferensis]
MKKIYIGAILFGMILSSISNENKYTFKKYESIEENLEASGQMNTSIYLDPTIDFSSDKMTSIIIEFKIKPAVIAVKEAQASGKQLTLDEATKQVEESHQKFQSELKSLLADHQVPYAVRHTYKSALNGVSMELPGKDIKRLLQSTVIDRIYPNKKVHIMPPITPFNQM